MIRIKWTSKSKKEKQKIPVDTIVIDRGRAKERTKGFGGGTRESGFPPFDRTFP